MSHSAEGVIKNITFVGEEVFFTLEPTEPYVFAKRNGGGTMERSLLLVSDDSKEAIILDANHKFRAPKSADFHSLIIAKANRMMVKIKVPNIKKDSTLVSDIEIQ